MSRQQQREAPGDAPAHTRPPRQRPGGPQRVPYVPNLPEDPSDIYKTRASRATCLTINPYPR
jgi:hypothetical protein